MRDLYFPYRVTGEPVTEIAGPGNASLRFLRIRLLNLTEKRPEWDFDTGEEEVILDITGGLCTIHIRSQSGNAVFPEIGGRQNVFAGKPTVAYFPRGARVSLFAETPLFE